MFRINRKSSWYPWVCWIIAASIYLIQYGLLAFPASISGQLQNSLSLNPLELGIFFSAFLYPYVLMQIPVGLLYDRYNARMLLVNSTAVMVAGCILLVFSHNLTTGIISRMLMGLGGSFAFVGAIYLGRSWFSMTLFPIVVGLTEAMSGIGSFGFNSIFSALAPIQGWHTILIEITTLTIVLGILTQIFVREHDKKSGSTASRKRLKQSTKIIFRNPNVWIIALYTGFGFVHYMTLTNMWEVRFLIQRYHIPTLYAVLEDSLVIIGFIIGSPLCGLLARYYNYLKVMMAGALLQVVLLMMIHYFTFGLLVESICLFSLGIVTGTIILSFEAVRKETPKAAYGLASGFINMFFAGFSILISPLIGFLYQTTSRNLEVAVFPVIVCSIISVLFCLTLIIKKRKKGRRLSI